jgi:hypothetical protein
MERTVRRGDLNVSVPHAPRRRRRCTLVCASGFSAERASRGARAPGRRRALLPSVSRHAGFVWDSLFAANALRIADAADSRTYGTLVSSMMLQAIPTSAPARRADHRTPPHGVLRPPSARKTRSQPIALTEAQRGWVMNVLKHGYLREYEAAYRAGRISNYPLLPSERMVRGLAKWRDTPRPLSRDAALEMFYHLEAVAGVEHEPGRGWNGVRRIAADLVEYLETDERVQDSVLANSKGTRHSRYQEIAAPVDPCAGERHPRQDARWSRAGRGRASVNRRDDRRTPRGRHLPHRRPAGCARHGADKRRRTEEWDGFAVNCAPRCTPNKNCRGTCLRRQFCYPLCCNDLPQERATGLEPATSSLGSWHSTN